MTNLLLHAGAISAERSKVFEVATPEPKGQWYPIPHHVLLEEVEGALRSSGLRIASEAHALGADNQRYFGLLELAPQDGEKDRDFAVVVGLRNSHDKSYAAGLVLGSSVFVCDNLSFHGEVNLQRKHTVNIVRDLPVLTQRGIGRLLNYRGRQEKRIERYKEFELGDVAANDLVIRALDAKAITTQSIPAVLQEWRHPRHEEFRSGGKTAWRLYNAFTEVAKGSQLNTLVRRSEGLHGLLDAHTGVLFADELPPLPKDAAEIVAHNAV